MHRDRHSHHRPGGRRPGRHGASDAPASTPRPADQVLGDLHRLLAVAHVPGPYVLVGASAGRLLVQSYAVRYPDDVAGVVSMNPVPPWAAWSRRL